MASKAAKTTATSKDNTSKKVETKAPVNVLADPVNVLADKKTVEKKAEVKAEAKVETKAAPKADTEAKAEPQKKRRGRPAGSTNKAAVGRTAAKRVGRPAGKRNAKTEAAAINPETFVEYHNNQYSENEIMQKVIKAWEADGKKVSAIKHVKLYVKPEDGKAYYVINEGLKTGCTGAVDL